jgi:hypothetical protein
MNIAEPMTVLTDYLLAVVSAVLGFLLYRSRNNQSSRSYWAIAFFAVAAAAALGGTWHGFPAPALSRATLFKLWTLTLFSAGVASACMVAGSAYAAASGGIRLALLAFALVKLAGYVLWIQVNQGFIVVILDTGIAMGIVAVLHALDRANPSSRWMLAGVAVSLAGAAVQALRLAPHPDFNHNDLYHVIQCTAMAFYFRGVATMQDRRRPQE